MRLFKCEICGNFVELTKDGGGTLVCCGQDMKAINLNTEETTFEKHIPVITRSGNTITVQVGSVIHPMIETHYIEWIAVVEAGLVTKRYLNPNQQPIAVFEITTDSFEVYEYCNLHGLYKAN